VPINRIPRVETPRLPEITVIDEINIRPITAPLPPPVTTRLAPPIIEVPSVDVPSYDPPSYEEEKMIFGGVNKKEEEKEEEEPSRDLPPPPIPRVTRPEIVVPGTDFVVPLPTQREVTLAGTTAVGATIAALAGKSLVEQLLKVFKPLAKKLILQSKKMLKKDFTPYELQTFLELEGSKELRKLRKQLQKEQDLERATQASEWAALAEQQRRLRTLSHTETKDERRSPSGAPLHISEDGLTQNPDELYPSQLSDD